jgi:hypothetical protein
LRPISHYGVYYLDLVRKTDHLSSEITFHKFWETLAVVGKVRMSAVGKEGMGAVGKGRMAFHRRDIVAEKRNFCGNQCSQHTCCCVRLVDDRSVVNEAKIRNFEVRRAEKGKKPAPVEKIVRCLMMYA